VLRQWLWFLPKVHQAEAWPCLVGLAQPDGERFHSFVHVPILLLTPNTVVLGRGVLQLGKFKGQECPPSL
jgi:hypothetical protein